MKSKRILSTLLAVIMVVCMLSISVSAMQVFVYISIEDSTIALNVEPADSIENVKQKIQDKEGISPDTINLFFNETLLDDGQTLGDYNIQSEDTIQVKSKHTHCVCGGDTNIGDHTTHDDIEFTPWTSTDSMPTTAGNYELMNDVTLGTDVWEAADGTVLCLNGHTLTLMAVNVRNDFTLCDCTGDGKIIGSGGSVYTIAMAGSATFTMYGGTVFGSDGQSGVYVYGNFNMYGGTIKNGKNNKGGGVFLEKISYAAQMTMYGGTISGNQATNSGGGVYIGNGTTFTMNGGTVSNNTSSGFGGGVLNEGTFVMTGGNITGNRSVERGGGVYVSGTSTFDMRGGTITENAVDASTNGAYGGGVFVFCGGAMTISGNSVITENTADGQVSNLHLQYNESEDKQVVVNVGTLTSGANIGISMYKYGVFSVGGKDYAASFFSDNAAYTIVADGDNLKLIEKVIPTIAFASGYNPDKTYDGQPISVPTEDDLEIVGAEYSDVVFTWTAKEGSSLTDGKPLNAGEYTLTATIPATDDREEAGATRTYSIGKVSLYTGNTIPDIYWGETVASDSNVEQCLELPDYLAYGNYVITMVGHGNDYVQGNTHDHFSKIAIEGRNLIWSGSDTMVVGDNYSFTVELDSINYDWTGEVEMDVITHTHNYTYSANGAVITESCSCTHSETATIKVPTGELDYFGEEYQSWITYSIGWAGNRDYELSYLKDGDIPEYLDGAGTYTVSLTIEGVTATASYTIKKAPNVITNLEDVSKIYDGKAVKKPEFSRMTFSLGDVSYDYKPYGADDSEYTNLSPKNVGKYTCRITMAEDANYTEAVATVDFEITQATPTILEAPTAKPVRRDKALSASTIKGEAFDVDGNLLEGSFEWADGSEIMSKKGTHTRTAIFTPTDNNYKAVEIDVEVEVYSIDEGGYSGSSSEIIVEPDPDIEAPSAEDTTTTDNPFIDISEDDWYYDEVLKAYNSGFIAGTSGNAFSPNGDITRAMFVTMIYRAEGEPESGEYTFNDVESGEWYTDAVAWASENEIVYGYSEEEFGPNDKITREQIAAIMFRYAKYKDVAPQGMWAIRLDFSDLAEVSDWATEGVMYCKLKGIMQGKGDNLFAPKDNTTRAEATAILVRFIAN